MKENNQSTLSRKMTLALINLLLATAMGAMLRFAFVKELPWLDYRFWMNGHSHVAMLGWLYLALYILIIRLFLPEANRNSRFFDRLFRLTQASVAGMLIAFPLQGYAFWSILFSTMHIFFSYAFVWKAWILTRMDSTPEAGFLRTSLFFMVLSTMGLWTMGPIMAMELQGSAWYYGAVQFFLHFQFNGWFTFAVLALLFRTLRNQGVRLEESSIRRFGMMLTVASIPTYALAVAWSNPHPAIFAVNSLGVLLQFAALILFVDLLRKTGSWQLPTRVLWLFRIGLAGFLLKMLIQTAVVLPAIAKVAYTVRNYVIGFIHLILLGTITFILFGVSDLYKIWPFESRLSKFGLWLVVTGFLAMELVLFLQGTLFWANWGFLPRYYEVIFAVSALVPAGVAIILAGRSKHSGISA